MRVLGYRTILILTLTPLTILLPIAATFYSLVSGSYWVWEISLYFVLCNTWITVGIILLIQLLVILSRTPHQSTP